jgi:hypothetical protein
VVGFASAVYATLVRDPVRRRAVRGSSVGRIVALPQPAASAAASGSAKMVCYTRIYCSVIEWTDTLSDNVASRRRLV